MKLRSLLLLPLILSVLTLSARADELVPQQTVPTVKPQATPAQAATPAATPPPPVVPITPPLQQPIPAFVSLPAPHPAQATSAAAVTPIAMPVAVTPTVAPPVPTNPLAVSVPDPGLAAAPSPTPKADKTSWYIADGLILAGLFAADRNVHNATASSNSGLAEGLTWFGNGINDAAIAEIMHLTGDERQREAGAVALRAVLDAGVNVQVLKTLFGRENPDFGTNTGQFSGPRLLAGHDSFPSGHTATAFAMATALADYYPQQKIPLYLGASAVGISTVYRHFHWPSDVFAGALLGIASGKEAVRHQPNFLDIKF